MDLRNVSYKDFPDFLKQVSQAGYTQALYMRYLLPLSDEIKWGSSGLVVPASEGLARLTTTIDALTEGAKAIEGLGAKVEVGLNNNDAELYVAMKSDDLAFYNALATLFEKSGTPWRINGLEKSEQVAESVLTERFGKTTHWNKISKQARKSFKTYIGLITIKPVEGYVFSRT